MFKLFLIIIFFSILFYIFNKINRLEHLCFGNDFCNGNKDNALCINQECYECGLNAKCKKNSDCAPNNCKNGCCDGQ
jgi:hypothetical protein